MRQAEDTTSWTSKYLKGNESLRTLVNTLLELAYLAPHRSGVGLKAIICDPKTLQRFCHRTNLWVGE